MIVLDVETTGVDSRKHSIISLGALEFENPSNQFYSECRVWEGAHIEDKSLAINGFTKKEITDPKKESLKLLMISFIEWVSSTKEHTPAGHNISFDMEFLNDSAQRYHLNLGLPRRFVDTHSLTYMHMIKDGKNPPIDKKKERTAITSDVVFQYTGISTERLRHNALEDAQLTAEAISRLLYDRILFEKYQNKEIPWTSVH